MAIDLVNGHVPFPQHPNWDKAPDWKRVWQTEVSGAVTGAESRQALRAVPRVNLTWFITTSNQADSWDLDERIRTAKKSGKGCVPYWGRGQTLVANVVADSCQVTGSWTWKVGDYIFFSSLSGSEVRVVTAVAGGTLTLDQAVARDYAAGDYCWPMLFGKFILKDVSARLGDYAEAQITIQELTARDSVGLGVVPGPAVGIGGWVIGSTFVVS